MDKIEFADNLSYRLMLISLLIDNNHKPRLEASKKQA
jgi:hypothetical protein